MNNLLTKSQFDDLNEDEQKSFLKPYIDASRGLGKTQMNTQTLMYYILDPDEYEGVFGGE